MTPEERRAAVTALGFPAFRADQLSRQYFTRLVRDAEAMSDLPARDRVPLGDALLPPLLTAVEELDADAGATRKTLWELHDGTRVESVLMRYGSTASVPGAASADGPVDRSNGAQLGSETDEVLEDLKGGEELGGPDDGSASVEAGRRRGRATICVSSQAGCGIGCPFCATGQLGLERNLGTAEIVEQVMAAARSLRSGVLPGGAGRITNVVFMGMGEPLANYRSVLAAIRRIVEPTPSGLGLSARGVTVSTVGLAPRMRELAAAGLPVTLALSLHAPDDEARDELVPINTRWPVAEVLDTARAYFDATGRRVSIEYALIRDVNDQAWRADLLGRLLNARGRGWVHVNPIPLNPTPGSRWTASRPAAERAFVDALRARGVPTTVRDTRGQGIDGACGQLAAGTARRSG